MGKIGGLLIAAVGIAVNVIPGVGQAISGAILGLTSATFTAVSSALTLFGIQSAINLGTSLFSPGAPKPAAAQSQQRHPTPPRVYLDGSRRRSAAVVILSDGLRPCP